MIRRALPLLLVAALAHARVLIHTAKPGDTPEALAAEYYGNRALALFILEANGVAPSAGGPRRAFHPGQRVRIPTAFHYRMKRGETLEKVAARFLDDKRRAPFLARWSGLAATDKGHEGADLLVPFQLVHRAAAPESMAALARSFYGDASQARLLLAYNFRSSPVLAPGEKLVVPIAHVRVRAVLQPPSPPPRAPASAKASDEAPRPPPQDTAEREAELAARVAARLALAEAAWREGRYDDIPAALTKLLSEEDPSEKQLVEIHRLLAFAYVALGADEVAVKEFREVLERDPDARLDPSLASPKIRAAFERARKGP